MDPDVSVAAQALASQREILALVSATGERHGELSERLAPLAATHQAHADLLADAVPKGVIVPASPSTPVSPTVPVSPSVSASPSTTQEPDAERRVHVPPSPERALARVAEAERQLVVVTKRQSFQAQSGAFARILGSMAAAAAQHATVLSAPSGSDGAS